jgi:arylsulfatase A-like enzyme
MYDPEGARDLIPPTALKRRRDLPADVVEEAVARLEMAYASEISYADAHVARLLDELRARGILDDALVVVTSDHGECLWEHGEEFDHGWTVYQATMHGLCVMRLPGGVAGGRRVDGLVASIDVMPTILEAAGLAVPEGIDGEAIPLRPGEGSVEGRTRFGEATKPREAAETDPRWTNIRKARCIREGAHKFISTPYFGTEEMYDVFDDPREIRDLLTVEAGSEPPSAADLRGRLSKWTESASPLPSWFDSSQTEESIRRLRSLGYMN